ncbi:C2H2 type zinc finger domain-containing protein [Purpureocillium lavendulum]|uniref:C2H2 type zinc finger domain-containing protein n=1 Tax=Purpureocillium lavendulum TaxID=1247861 RepID=A0AB34FMW3_9HYPO|nr:C2H2 type zinc finger domain-containing protein [Purpureocillium lavendulum]
MMTTARHQQQLPQLQILSAADTFDPDEVVPRDSPLMQALRPKLELSPSPPPDIPPAQVSLSPPPIDDFFTSNRSKIRPSSGDAVLVSYLDNGRRPELARAAGAQALPDAEDEDDDDDSSHHHLSPGSAESLRARDVPSGAKSGNRKEPLYT